MSIKIWDFPKSCGKRFRKITPFGKFRFFESGKSYPQKTEVVQITFQIPELLENKGVARFFRGNERGGKEKFCTGELSQLFVKCSFYEKFSPTFHKEGLNIVDNYFDDNFRKLFDDYFFENSVRIRFDGQLLFQNFIRKIIFAFIRQRQKLTGGRIVHVDINFFVGFFALIQKRWQPFQRKAATKIK